MQKPRVILIFGEPNSGKSCLAGNLASQHGYDTISVDEVYLEFIKELYPKLYLESLNIIVSQHYNMILKATHKYGEKEWAHYLARAIMVYLKGRSAIAVEGHLLTPVLKTVRARLSKVASVTAVYVKDRRYYASATIKGIARV